MSCILAHDSQLARLATAIAQRVGQQRFHVWFNNSTRLDLKNDGLEIAVPNDFISEWIGTHFKQPIQDAAVEVLGCSLPVRFHVAPQLFEVERESLGTAGGAGGAGSAGAGGAGGAGRAIATATPAPARAAAAVAERPAPRAEMRHPAPLRHAPQRLRHDLDTFVVGPANQLAFNAASYVAEFPGVQYNPLFIHGACGLGKTHLLQGLCRRFAVHHPTKRFTYLTGEEFTNDFLTALRGNRLDGFRRRMREMDLLVIDDVHFLGGKKATQEEFLHTFNAIEAMGRQVVIASDHHPKMIEEFGESLVNRFVSGMVVRIDAPNFNTRCQILRKLLHVGGMRLDEEAVQWIARRVTHNVRELEGAITRVAAHVKLTGRVADLALVQEAMGDLDRQLVAPINPDGIIAAVSTYFGVEQRHLMSGSRQRTVSLARSLAMYLIRRCAKLSYPEIGARLGKRNHSTVISACRRMEQAVAANEPLPWTSSVGERQEEAAELIQRLEDLARGAAA